MKLNVISKRVSISDEGNVFSLVILPTEKNWKLWLLFLWLFAWTICGVLVASNYFAMPDQKGKIIVIVYLSFWAYFEWMIGKTFLFRKFGKEKLWMKNQTLYYQKEVMGKGKVNTYETSLVNQLNKVEQDKSSFITLLNNAFWMLGGETISFNYAAKEIRFGIQLSEEETKKIIFEIKQQLKKSN
jgi:hypothetical protein